MKVHIELNRANDAVLARVTGRVTVDSAFELGHTLMEAIEQEPAHLTLDLADVPFIDTSGLGVLLSIRSEARKAGVDLEVVNLQDRVKAVFRLTRLTSLFGIEDR